jgi:hypothetical protein
MRLLALASAGRWVAASGGINKYKALNLFSIGVV